MNSVSAQKLERIKALMGDKYVFHPDYNKNKPPHHTTRERNSSILRSVKATAVAEGRL